MQYFTKELWCAANSADPEIRRQAREQLRENDIHYTEAFQKMKKHLPGAFVEIFLSRCGFHDYAIKSITMFHVSGKNCCRMTLSDHASEITLTMKDIQRMELDIPSFKNCIMNNLSWGYSEFTVTADKNIQLALLCDLDSEMLFVFKKIEVVIGEKSGDSDRGISSAFRKLFKGTRGRSARIK